MRFLALGAIRRCATVLRASSLLWLMFVLTQPVAIHACPLRNDPSVTSTSSAVATHDQSAQRVLASGSVLCEPGQAGHPAAAATPSHPAQGMTHTSSPTHSHQQGATTCHCVGTCCVGLMMTPSVSGSIVPVPTAIAAAREQYPTVTRVVQAPAYRLPPATAPPIA